MVATLAEVLRRVGAPLDRADLVLLVASVMFDKMEPLRREALARVLDRDSRNRTTDERNKFAMRGQVQALIEFVAIQARLI
jgi:hypothetical protein